MVKRILSIALLCGLAWCVCSCGDSAQKRARLSKAEKARLDSIDRASLKVGVMPTLDCLPVLVAKDCHLFDTLGVDVHLRQFNAQMDCDTALIHKRVEGSVTDLVRACRLQSNGVKLTYPIVTSAYWQIISNKRSRISKLKQLSDKMIGMTRYSATDYLATLAIDSVHPKYDVYRVQINDVNIRLKMLLNNEMDAVLLAEPQATRARLDGHVVLMDSRDKNVRLGVFAFRTDALKEPHRKQQLALFTKAYDMAVDSINKYGVIHYKDLIMKYCGVDARTADALPKFRYQHAESPRQHDLNLVDRSHIKSSKEN